MRTSFSISRRLAVAAVLVGIVPGVVLASSGVATEASPDKERRSDPAASMSEAEQVADHERQWATYQASYGSWLASVASDLDFTTVERVELLALPEAPPGSLSEAVQQASLIVVATVEAVQFLPSLTTVADLRVEQTLKGLPLPRLTIVQAGGPLPRDADWDEAVLAEATATPILLTGDRALLLLNHDGTQHYVQSLTGELRIIDNRVTALDGHPAKAQIDGKALADVVDMVLAELN